MMPPSLVWIGSITSDARVQQLSHRGYTAFTSPVQMLRTRNTGTVMFQIILLVFGIGPASGQSAVQCHMRTEYIRLYPAVVTPLQCPDCHSNDHHHAAHQLTYAGAGTAVNFALVIQCWKAWYLQHNDCVDTLCVVDSVDMLCRYV